MAELNRVGLIGWPVEHSVSPAMHNAAFKALGMDDWEYELLPTPLNELEERVKSLIDRGYKGANVTIPHKQNIMPMLSSIALSARGADAVNTLIIEGGRIEGHNTDVYGVRADLEQHGVQLPGLHVLVLGAGGAAHAAVVALANAGAKVTVINRRSQRAWDLYRNVRRGVPGNINTGTFNVSVQEQSALPKVAPTVQLIINCTSAGMAPHYLNTSPWPNDVPIPLGITVYDMVYRPEKTLFMQQAEDAGATAIGGLGMLVHQGAASFQLWTGKEPDIAVMTAAAKEALQHDFTAPQE